jgi:mono/diheme cytochrome c family protein
MSRNKTRRFIKYNSAILTAVVTLTLFPISVVRANPAQNSAAVSAAFRTKCAMCHGDDGAGSDVGKSMNVPDLRSDTVQKLPDTELAQAISNGKGGMPSFKNSLNADQIQGLVKHVRSLAAKK